MSENYILTQVNIMKIDFLISFHKKILLRYTIWTNLLLFKSINMTSYLEYNIFLIAS